MFAKFNENLAMTLQDIKETKRYGQTDAGTDNVKTVYPLQTKFAGGIIILAILVRISIFRAKNINVSFSINFNIYFGCSKSIELSH